MKYWAPIYKLSGFAKWNNAQFINIEPQFMKYWDLRENMLWLKETENSQKIHRKLYRKIHRKFTEKFTEKLQKSHRRKYICDPIFSEI